MNFEFPLWNPYWGAGHEAVIWATVPIDPYTIIELILGYHYAFFHLVQCMALVMAGYYVFRKFKFDPWAAASSSLLFFMSPLVTHWYFHFIKTNLFIAHMFTFIFMVKWFETRQFRYVLLLGWSFFLGMFGTKLEFWFYEFVFFTLSPIIAFFIMKPQKPSMVVMTLASILVAILAHAWQINLLIGALNNSNRLGTIPHGLHNLFSSEMYRNLYLSLGDSDLFPLALICVLLFTGLRSKSFSGWFFVTGILVAFLFRFWEFSFLSLFLHSPVLFGALFATILTIRTPSSREYLLSTWILFMLPAYYWCKPLVDYDELWLLRKAPILFQGIWGFLVWLGCLQVHRYRTAQLAYLCVPMVFLLQKQGQIILSYLFGYVWLSGRDNYLIDFSFALLAAFGTTTYFRFKPMLIRLTPFIIALSAYPKLYYAAPLEPEPDYADTLLNFRLPYGPFKGVPSLRKIIHEWDYLPYRRVIDPDIDTVYRVPQNHGTFLLEHTGNATFYGSIVPARYSEIINFYRYGITPQDNIGAYPSVYSKKTMSRLPKVNTKGYAHGERYFMTVWIIPPLELDLLQLLGIDYIITRDAKLLPPMVNSLKLRNVMEIDKFTVAELSDTLPRTFLVLNVNQENLQEFQENMRPRIELERAESLLLSNVYIARPARFLRYEPEYVAIQTESSSGGYLVLTDIFHPYWSAIVDGNVAEIIPAFHVFRAVKVPPGSHKVEFFCSVPYFRLAFLVSFILIGISSVLTFRFWKTVY